MDNAAEHDSVRARELCASVQAGEIVIFDKAYVDFDHLADLSQRGVFWVTRAKDNLQCRVVRKVQEGIHPCLKTLIFGIIQAFSWIFRVTLSISPQIRTLPTNRHD